MTTTFDKEAIKARIAKMLRLQASNNVGEAANAAAMVEKLCQEYGLTSSDLADCAREEDDSREVVCMEIKVNGKRVSVGKKWLLNAVAKYFNGAMVGKQLEGGGWNYEVTASVGNQIQIDLYFDYLIEQAKRQSEIAKGEALDRGLTIDRGFAATFLKGFALEVAHRLRKMKEDQEVDGYQTGTGQQVSGLVLLDRNKRQLARVEAFTAQQYGRLRNDSGGSLGRGAGVILGREAGRSVSLRQQVGGGHVMALPGGR